MCGDILVLDPLKTRVIYQFPRLLDLPSTSVEWSVFGLSLPSIYRDQFRISPRKIVNQQAFCTKLVLFMIIVHLFVLAPECAYRHANLSIRAFFLLWGRLFWAPSGSGKWFTLLHRAISLAFSSQRWLVVWGLCYLLKFCICSCFILSPI